MGVKKHEELLCKVAFNFVHGKIDKSFLLRAAMLYAESKNKARERRDLWKLRKRLKTEENSNGKSNN